MADHPIEGLMLTAMNSIKDMIDVNTIIGEPIQASNNIVIIPISKVSFGFASGGSDFESKSEYKSKEDKYPFGGGCGAGVTVKPVAFLVVRKEKVVLLPVENKNAYDRLFDAVPQVLENIKELINNFISKKGNSSSENASIKINENE